MVPLGPAFDRGPQALEPGSDLTDGPAVIDDKSGDLKTVTGCEGCISVKHRRPPVWLGWIKALPIPHGGLRHVSGSHTFDQRLRSVQLVTLERTELDEITTRVDFFICIHRLRLRDVLRPVVNLHRVHVEVIRVSSGIILLLRDQTIALLPNNLVLVPSKQVS